jgi:hypothetical protein
MDFTVPLNNPRRTRLLTIGYGVMVFFWLRIEDNSVLPAVIGGLGLSLLGAHLWLTKNLSGKILRLGYLVIGSVSFGVVCGLATSAVAAGLMLLKNGMHGHVFPDFPFGVIVEILQRAPVWALAGGLAGLGLALAWWALTRS